MRDKPWQDIYTNEQWAAILGKYRKGKISSKSKKFIHHVRRVMSLTQKFALPREVVSLTQQITHYHNIDKRNVSNLEARAGLLRNIINTGDLFIRRNSIPLKSHQKIELNEEEYKNYKTSLDYAVSKLLRRAKRKADYIATLKLHVENADRGFAGSKIELLDYIKQKANSPYDEDLVRMGSDVALEKIDPWHRPFEATFSSSQAGGVVLNSNSSIFSAAFNQWIFDTQNDDAPFFVWLEGHYVCTNVTDARLLDMGGNVVYTEPKAHVQYGQSDVEVSTKLPFIVANKGRLWAYKATEDGNFDDVDYFDTKFSAKDFPDDAQDMAKGKFRAHAYVWSRDNFIFAGPHIGNKFHHSSFISGRKVRCAGMIVVENGLVTRVDNDSGHYKPGTRHLRNFVQFLSAQNVLAPNAKVEDKSVKPAVLVSATAFIAGVKDMKIETNFKRMNARKTTLRDIVEERFQELKIELGQAPEHSLWIRAYKLVCTEFGELDPKWKTKANAPAIPRERASRGR